MCLVLVLCINSSGWRARSKIKYISFLIVNVHHGFFHRIVINQNISLEHVLKFTEFCAAYWQVTKYGMLRGYQKVGGARGREPGRIRAGGEWEAGEDGAGCGCRTRAGCSPEKNAGH